APFGGVPSPVPGRIEAENFDEGGEGLGYHTSNPINYTGGLYRSTGVTVENSGDTGDGYNVGYLRAGDYLRYTVNVTAAGTYDFSARVANAAAGGAFGLEIDNNAIATHISVPNTGGWQTYQTVTHPAVFLPAGTHVVTLRMETGNPFGYTANFNWIEFTA